MRAQLHQLRGLLDAFCRRLDVERVGELGDRADDGARAVAGQQVLDEAAVDLELVEREALQIAERRIAGAEIVERDADAERAQRVEQPQRRLAAFEEDRFGDLDLEPVRREPAVGKREQDGFVELAAVELHRRDVDRDADMLGPARRLRAGFAEHPGADRHDQPGILGDRDELGRRNQPARRVVPADQRLERADAIVLEVEQRLVEQFELAALEREAEVGLELAALLRALVEAFLEEGVGAAPGFLGAIQREIGVAQQGLAIARRPAARWRCRCWSTARTHCRR